MLSHAVCVSVYPPHQLLMPEPIFMKVNIYITAPESISTAYFINPSNLSVYVCIPLSLLGSGLENMFPRQRIQTQQ
jgi:hypothetical protein